MKKNTELVEFFACPDCKHFSWECVDYVPLNSTSEYACLAECDHCGQELLVVDTAARCTKCKNKVECMATPLKLVQATAMAIHKDSVSEIKRTIERLEKQNGL